MAKILITGGHLTPALALIDHIHSSAPQVDVVFVGRLLNRETDEQPSQEKYEIERRTIRFIAFDAPKFQLQPFWQIPLRLVKFSRAVMHALSILREEKPDVCVFFGSYVAVPVAVAAWILNIPSITHEQTRAAGIANQFISRLSKAIAISFPESSKYFPPAKTHLTGNLLRKQLTSAARKPEWFSTSSSLPILYITGGSQGSEVINSTVCQILNRILRDWIVVHQCGASSTHHRYRDELLSTRSTLQRSYQDRYFIREWLTESELGWVYQHTALAISRAGANTTQELAQHQIPAILIPLPFSNHNEQEENTKPLVECGGAIVIRQHDLTPERLLAELKKLGAKYKACKRKLAQVKYPDDAAEKVYSLIVPFLPIHETPEKTK